MTVGSNTVKTKIKDVEEKKDYKCTKYTSIYRINPTTKNR